MTNILYVTTSPRGEASLSAQVANTLLDTLKADTPDAAVVTRELGDATLQHLGPDLLAGFFAPADKQTPAQKAAVAQSDELVAELNAADTVVIASAMINFTITSTLKAWLDNLARSGITFRYTDKGVPEGLMTGKKVFVVAATGGVYSTAPNNAVDFQTPYLKHMLGFMGMTDVEIVRVEGSVFSPEAAEKAVNDANVQARSAARHAIAA